MNFFEYRNGRLFAEDVPVERIAGEVGTPCYIYSEATLRRHFRLVREAFAEVEHLVCYSVKANSSLQILRLLKEEGAGFDIVSGGELYRVLKVGADPSRIVYAGVGKTRSEIEYALRSGILMFNAESPGELEAIDAVAASLRRRAPVSIRVNPNVDAKTGHVYTTTGRRGNKFGIDAEAANALPAARARFQRYLAAQRPAPVEVRAVASRPGRFEREGVTPVLVPDEVPDRRPPLTQLLLADELVGVGVERRLDEIRDVEVGLEERLLSDLVLDAHGVSRGGDLDVLLGSFAQATHAFQNVGAFFQRDWVVGRELVGARIDFECLIQTMRLKQGQAQAAVGRRVFGELLNGAAIGHDSPVPLLVPGGDVPGVHCLVVDFAVSSHQLSGRPTGPFLF